MLGIPPRHKRLRRMRRGALYTSRPTALPIPPAWETPNPARMPAASDRGSQPIHWLGNDVAWVECVPLGTRLYTSTKPIISAGNAAGGCCLLRLGLDAPRFDAKPLNAFKGETIKPSANPGRSCGCRRASCRGTTRGSPWRRRTSCRRGARG